eukprot:5631768-Pyramimonas_sp.AAC.1
MAGSGQPDWAGLLKWSLAHSDGTAPARQISEEERKWCGTSSTVPRVIIGVLFVCALYLVPVHAYG